MLEKIYNKLKKISEGNEAFYSSIQEIDGYSIESFSYRLASFDDFKLPFVKEMRGIAFIYGKEIHEPKLFTLGFHKFFNYHEGNISEIVKNDEIESIQDKIDGSLIMFGLLPNGKLIAKSKTSINSSVADSSNKIIKSDKKLENFIKKYLNLGIFPIFEYVGLDNRIVLSYKKSELILLGMRKINGEYLSLKDVLKIQDNEIPHISFTKNFENLTINDILDKQKNEQGYEGFVVSYKSGEKVKFKLMSYVEKHKMKEDISNPKKLIQICLNEQTDDLRTLFSDDSIALEIIDKAEEKVFHIYNHVVSETKKEFEKYKDVYEKFRNTDDIDLKKALRKEFVMKVKTYDYFALLMTMLDDKEVDYKTFVAGIVELD